MNKQPHSRQKNKVKKICRYKPDCRFEHFTSNNVVPEGYMTSEEFRKRAIVKVNTFCAEHGVLQ